MMHKGVHILLEGILKVAGRGVLPDCLAVVKQAAFQAALKDYMSGILGLSLKVCDNCRWLQVDVHVNCFLLDGSEEFSLSNI